MRLSYERERRAAACLVGGAGDGGMVLTYAEKKLEPIQKENSPVKTG